MSAPGEECRLGGVPGPPGPFAETNRELRYRYLIDVSGLAVVVLDRDLRLRSCSPPAETLLELTDADMGEHVGAVLTRKLGRDAEIVVRRARDEMCTIELEVRCPRDRWHLLRARPAERGCGIDGVVVTLFDVHRWRRWRALHLGQARVLELLATGRPLSKVLEALALVIEDQVRDARASVLLLGADGSRLLHGAAPHLPSGFNRAVNGIAIGPTAGSCGTAAYREARIVVTDTSTDPHWADLRDLAVRFDIGACWSEPIRSADGRVLGTFAMLFRETRAPRPEELSLMEWAAHLAGIAIDRARSESSLWHARDRLARTLEQRSAELRRAREEVRRHQAEMSHIARLCTVGEMAAALAHELSQPVTAVAGFAEACRRAAGRSGRDHDRGEDAGRPDELRECLEGIEHQAERAARMIRRLRSFVRKTPVMRTRHDMNDLVREIVPLIEVEAARTGVEVVVELAAEPIHVEVEAIAIEQVILNLARNGVEAMAGSAETPGTPRTDRTLHVRVSRAGDHHVQVAVADAGPGIPPDDLARVFEPFFTGKPGGLGLGLSVARTLIDAHGGRIWAVSRRAGGETFRFVLPLDEHQRTRS